MGFLNNDPAHTDFQYLENLATAYWYSNVLFTAIELGLFTFLNQGHNQLSDLAETAQCREPELKRLLTALEAVALVLNHGGGWHNHQVTARFLVKGKPEYMGDFFLYRQYMRPNWNELTCRVGRNRTPHPEVETQASMGRSLDDGNPESCESYAGRTDQYVGAMDTLVCQKAREIATLLRHETLSGRVLDVGGGAGSLVRALIRENVVEKALLFDLPEVIASARRIYPDPDSWDRIKTMEGDFRVHEFSRGQKFGLVILGNFLHAYGPKEARALLKKAVGLLEPQGMLLIHDYFPDFPGRVPQKGALYDLAMMLNTYNGACHTQKELVKWLNLAGMSRVCVKNLSTDTAVIAARETQCLAMDDDPWILRGRELGFAHMLPIDPEQVVTVPWSRLKCRFGCRGFDTNLECPPNGLDHEQTRQVLDAYSRAFLVQGVPPGRDFYKKLLSLEKQAFLSGFHKAFVFGAGPCTICSPCPGEGKCRFPHLARPSMEGSGMDVYATVKGAGLNLSPVREKGLFVKYTGLFLLE